MTIGNVGALNVQQRYNVSIQKANAQGKFGGQQITANAVIATNSNSKQNKTYSILEQLFTEKKSLNESKNELVANTLKEGKDLGTIKSQLEAYDKQLTDIDKKISEAAFADHKKALDSISSLNSSEKKNNTFDFFKQNADSSVNEMADALRFESDMSRMKIVSGMKAKMERTASVLESEIKLDASRSASSSKTNFKQSQLDKLNSRIDIISDATTSSKADEKVTSEQKQSVYKAMADMYIQNQNIPTERYEKSVMSIMI